MSPCITRLIASSTPRKPRRLPSRPPGASGGADGSRAAGGQRHGPGRPRPHVNDRNLDGRNFLCLSVGREWGEDRGGDGGDLHPCFDRRRTHADIHSYGDRIFGRDGVSDQRSDGRDCGGRRSPSASASGSWRPFVALHTYYMSPTGSDSNNGLTAATAWATPNHAVNCGDVIIAAAGSIRTFKVSGNRSAIARPLRAASMGRAASTSPRCSAAAPTSGHCYITTKTNTTGNTDAFQIAKQNWAVEGWYVNTSGHGRAFEGYRLRGRHITTCFINDISADNLQAAPTTAADEAGRRSRARLE